MEIHHQRRLIKRDIVRLLALVCLLFVTAGVTSAQSLPTVSINDVTASEELCGVSGLFGWTFQITLSAASATPVSFTATTQAGSASDVELVGDFVSGSIVLTFQPGQTSTTLDILVRGDTAAEGAEDFFVNLSNPVNATIADGQGKGTIIDDDSLILLTQENSQRAAALESIFFSKETFKVNNANFGPTNRTRIALFATGLNLTGPPVTATAEDSQGNVQPLTVEFVGKLPNPDFAWLTQVVVKFNDQPTTGDLKLRVSWDGHTSKPVPVAVQP
jgi:Calx-beta domain